MKKIYLDDIRTPVDTTWVVVRSYDEFVEKVLKWIDELLNPIQEFKFNFYITCYKMGR